MSVNLLLVVDVQNDFCEGGALPTAGGSEVVPVINQARRSFDQIVFTQDWHPQNHKSFAANHRGKKPGETIKLGDKEQILWPAHCVQGSEGAQLHPELVVRPQDAFFKKGTDPKIDSYSAFFDNRRLKSTGLAAYLRALGVREITVCGLATDYCVFFTVLDALSEEFRVNVLLEACRGIDLKPGDTARATAEMRKQGARMITLLSLGAN